MQIQGLIRCVTPKCGACLKVFRLNELRVSQVLLGIFIFIQAQFTHMFMIVFLCCTLVYIIICIGQQVWVLNQAMFIYVIEFGFLMSACLCVITELYILWEIFSLLVQADSLIESAATFRELMPLSQAVLVAQGRLRGEYAVASRP